MDVFLFPMVNVTLFPKTTKPLHIFEPRYLEMFRQAIATSKPIAIGFNDHPTAAGYVAPGQKVGFVREIAGYGTPQIIEERTNGSLLVLIHGTGKVRLGTVKESGTPYIVCSAEPIPEIVEVKDSVHPQIHALNNVMARWIENHIPEASQREMFVQNLSGPEEIVGAFASYLLKDYDFQQMILELNDINEKIYYLHRLAQSMELSL